jgi:hypothetical protein
VPLFFGRNIVVDGSSLGVASRDAYETTVHTELALLLAFETGRAVIEEIWGKHRRLRVVPYRNRRDPHNADATPTDDRAATFPFQPVRDGADGHIVPHGGLGTGRGSDVFVHYSPSVFHDEDAFEWDGTARAAYFNFLGTMPPDPGEDPEEVLLHELVHALRQMSGREDRMPMGHGFDTREEFLAVLITNMYSSERGSFRPLRADHNVAYLSDPATWRDNAEYHTLIRGITCSNPSLVHRLIAVKTAFNPFAGAYEHHPNLDELDGN